jgi:HSP20 family protein
MEVNQFSKWLDVAQQFQAEQFWNQFFDSKNTQQFSNSHSFTAINEYVPKCDLYEKDTKLIVEAEVPGLGKENLQISIHQQILTITGEFKSLTPNCQYYLKERVNRRFKKEITLPFPVNIHKVRTEINKGILVISMPINREEVEDIPIKVD